MNGEIEGPFELPVKVCMSFGNRMKEEYIMPAKQKRSILMPIHKDKGDIQECLLPYFHIWHQLYLKKQRKNGKNI